MKLLSFFQTLALLAAYFISPLSAQAPESIMVVEAYSGKILIATNSKAKRPIASLNKIATAIVAIDWAAATGTDIGNVEITAPETINLVGGPNPMNLQPGDKLNLRDALYSALLGSDNLAALAIADHVGREILAHRGNKGDPVAGFVAEMNELGKTIGLTDTRFANPHGLEREGAKAFSTAADVARMSMVAMKRNPFTFIARQTTREVSVTGPTSKRSYKVKNTNELAGELGILGVKTGTTNAAGPCISVCMDREPLVRPKPDGSKGATPRRLIVVVLNNPDRFNRARGLIQQGWRIYDSWLEGGATITDRDREILSVKEPQ